MRRFAPWVSSSITGNELSGPVPFRPRERRDLFLSVVVIYRIVRSGKAWQ